MAKTVQKTLHCPCGRLKVVALGLCASCYNLKRQDEEYFGGLRANRSSSGTSIAAEPAAPRAGIRARSSSIIGFPESRCCT
jgi:hypothetical protein